MWTYHLLAEVIDRGCHILIGPIVKALSVPVAPIYIFVTISPHEVFQLFYQKGKCLRYIKRFVNTKIAFKLQSLSTWHFFPRFFF